MRLLLIGASSFLGGHIRRAASGVTVVTSGRSLSGRYLSGRLAAGGLDVRMDLVADPVSRIASVVADAAPDAVINCAGATRGSAAELSDANVTAVERLLEALLSLPSPPRLVHIGSAAEYGAGTPDVPLAETAPCCPASLYGVTKLAGTRLVELGRASGLDAVSLRVFNVVGSGAPVGTLPGDAVAGLRGAVSTGPGPLDSRGVLRLGPLGGVRDFVDARDVADAVLAATASPALPPAVVNVGSGTAESARALIGHLLAASGHAVEVVEALAADEPGMPPGSGPGAARSPALSWQQADISLAERVLGWRPRHDLADAARDLWEGACELT